MLRSARLALAVTDVQRASRMVTEARREQIRYAPNEDSPERVEAAIARFVEVNRFDRATEENRRAYARMLMEQSEALLQWGELAQADKLAALAVEQRVSYGPFDAKPEDLLKRITLLRQQNNPAGPRLIDNRYAGPNAVGPSQAGRQQAVELMRQIRGALAARQVAQAEFLSRQLDALQIQENAFAPGEDRPGLVFQAVHEAMARNVSGVIQAGGFGGPNAASNRPFMIHRTIPPAQCRLPVKKQRRFPPRPTRRPAPVQSAGNSRRRRCLATRSTGCPVARLQSLPTG